MDAHNQAVSAISSQISGFNQRQVPFRLYHGSTNSTKSRKIDRAKVVDTSQLNHVLGVSRDGMTCVVEPNVPMDQLVDATLPHGVVPEVVMEFPGITVGGGFAGTAGESSGFRYGFFEHTVNWIEIVLATGVVVKASPREREDLFYGAAGTFGTLGVVTMLELRCIEAKRYVELTYHPTTAVSDALTTMQRATEVQANDYVDGILFAQDRGVIVSGRLTDEVAPGAKVQRFSRARDPWFYVHAERTIGRSLDGKPVREAVLLRDYLFRYDRGAFWTGRYAYYYFLTPFNRVTRWALDYFMRTRVMYHALHVSGHADKVMIQDLCLPIETVGQFIDYVDEDFGIWPLWLCPFTVDRELSMRPRLPSTSISTKSDGEKKEKKSTRDFINVGVWGPASPDYGKFVEMNRKLEHKVRELGGIKWLYAQAFYTEEELWEIYDRKWYDGLREKYHATYLPTVYDKVKMDLAKVNPEYLKTWSGWLRNYAWETWPVSGLWGVLKTLVKREYLLAK